MQSSDRRISSGASSFEFTFGYYETIKQRREISISLVILPISGGTQTSFNISLSFVIAQDNFHHLSMFHSNEPRLSYIAIRKHLPNVFLHTIFLITPILLRQCENVLFSVCIQCYMEYKHCNILPCNARGNLYDYQTLTHDKISQCKLCWCKICVNMWCFSRLHMEINNFFYPISVVNYIKKEKPQKQVMYKFQII